MESLLVARFFVSFFQLQSLRCHQKVCENFSDEKLILRKKKFWDESPVQMTHLLMTVKDSPALSNQFRLLPTTRQPIPPTPRSSTLRYTTPILQEVRSHKVVAWFRLCNVKIISLITRILLFWMPVKSLGDHTINITSSIISVEASCEV